VKTLIIHPADPTTDFLKEIYADKDWTVINDPVYPNAHLKVAINEHDRIIMLGHGTNFGLLGGVGANVRMMISSQHVYLLRNKICVCVWCNANEFVKRYALSGFHTGMIVSELDEAAMYSLPYKGIDESNKLFASSLKTALRKVEASEIWEAMRVSYDMADNAIVDFNRTNLFI